MFYLQILLGLGLFASCAYYILCVLSARRWYTAHDQIPNVQRLTPNAYPPLTLLKPLRGTDPQQYDNFASFCRQDYPQYQIVFGALDAADPGLETARRIAADFPRCDITIVAGGEAFGLNRKVCNLENMRGAAKYGLLVLCDSDMRAQPDYLRRIAAPFSDPSVGLVTCLYRGLRVENLVSALEALGIGTGFAPSVLVANQKEGLSFAFGSTIAIRAKTLEEIGGFRALADELADDYLLGNRVKRAGYRVVLSDYVIDDVLGRESFGTMWSRRLRWAKTVRAMRPAGYAGLFITHGVPLGLLFLLATGFGPTGWAGLGIVLAVRCVTATRIARAYTKDENLPRLLPLLPLSDLLSFALWIGSYWGRHVVWRGERFRLGRGGRLERE